MYSPLEGVRVLDCSIWQLGPSAAVILGDLGADVIKIEHRVQGDPSRGVIRFAGIEFLPGGRSVYFELNNRNKRGITLDLRKERGKEVLYQLVEKSDVFLHNFRKGVPEQLGLDYKTLSRYNPRLVYATGSGFGPHGPESHKTAYDFVGVARSGTAAYVGDPDQPPIYWRGALADQISAMTLASGIMAALLARERWGVAQEVDVSLLGTMINVQWINLGATLLCGKEPERLTRTKLDNPLYNIYCCADDRWIFLGLQHSDRHWPALCRALGMEELERDPRFVNMDQRRRNCDQLIPILDRIFASKPRSEWLKILEKGEDLIFTHVSTFSEVANDPQVLANDYITEFNHPVLGRIKLIGMPMKFSKTPTAIRRAAPEFGEHTEEVLREVAGYSWEEIGKLRDEEVI